MTHTREQKEQAAVAVASITNGQKHFDDLLKVYSTTGKVFKHWSENMTYQDRIDVMVYNNDKTLSYYNVIKSLERLSK